ncbi:MAG: ATP-binding cassette domain-containing protein [Synechococcales bacterium]|nr:ATP-binding cassette domain-containing protein [Synechococcales bacterium]
MAEVILENVYKTYPKERGESGKPISVLRSIHLSIADGEFMVLVGPSGCGKSTLLRMIAGLETVTGGTIRVGDRVVNALPPKERDIAMVFQSYALYPHLSVYDNLAFGLRRAVIPDQPQQQAWLDQIKVAMTRNLPKDLRYISDREQQIEQRVQQVAESLQIEALLHRLPKQLSGGQKQRVALGRAMARNPQVFLMDEPLSNLDAKLRAETRSQIVQLQRQLGTTTIYVTHDQTEAMTMGDRIAVLNEGQIQQIATPLELYNRPVNRFVAEFIGSPPMNFIPVQFKAPLRLTHGEFQMTLPDSWTEVLAPYDGWTLDLGIRPEHLSYSVPAPKNLPLQVNLVEALGSETFVSGQLALNSAEFGTRKWGTTIGISVAARIEAERAITLGERIWLTLQPEKIHLFEPGTGLAIRKR